VSNPKSLMFDRGFAFTSGEFADFLKSRNIVHHLVAIAAPWSNGLIEIINLFLKSSLQKLVEEQVLWTNHLKDVQYVINNTYHKSTKSTFLKLLFGYELWNRPDSNLSPFWTILQTNLILKLIDLDVEATNKIKEYNKAYQDARHKNPPVFLTGDYVVIRDITVKHGENRKLKLTYKGPYQITKVLSKNICCAGYTWLSGYLKPYNRFFLLIVWNVGWNRYLNSITSKPKVFFVKWKDWGGGGMEGRIQKLCFAHIRTYTEARAVSRTHFYGSGI